MVVAYLRGLLRPVHKFGQRSVVTEDIVIEVLTSEMIASNMQASIAAELSLVPVLNHKGLNDTIDKSNTRLVSASELRMFDIYKVAYQIGGTLKRNVKNELSLFQLYQIAEKSGIFSALDAQHAKAKFKPLF